MQSDQSSFRDFYCYPQHEDGLDKEQRHYRRAHGQAKQDSKRESFGKFVRKTKNVVMFAQRLKERISKHQFLTTHTLSNRELEYLQKEAVEPSLRTLFQNDNRLVFAVELLFTFVLLLYVWKASFQLLFMGDMAFQSLNFVVIGAYTLQVIFFCLTEQKTKRQHTISDCRSVFKAYLEEMGLLDLLTNILILIQGSALDQLTRIDQVPFVLRLLAVLLVSRRIKMSAEKIEATILASTNAETALSVFKLIFKIFCLLHILSIVLNLLADAEHHLGQETTWLSGTGVTHTDSLSRYVVGWYWGATILSSVGFGDITPSNNIERFVISIVQIVCCMSFGYFVNVIGSLIRLQTERDEKYDKETRFLNRYLNTLTLTLDLKQKVRSYFVNKHEVEKALDVGEEKTLLNKMSMPLRKSLLEENNVSVLKKSAKFEKMHSQTLNKLAQVLKRVVFAPQHIIYSRDTEERKLWLIESGKVEELTDLFGNSQIEKRVAFYNSADSAVGWTNFITQRTYSTIAKALEFTVAYELEEQNFRTVLLQSRSDLFRVAELKQLYLQSGKKYVRKCLSCDRFTHNVINCPRIHFIRRDVISILTQEKAVQQFRMSQRAAKRKFKRQALRDCWKSNFYGQENVQKIPRGCRQSEEKNSLNMTIDYFIKNITKIQSSKQISNKKISFLRRMDSRTSGTALEDLEPKENQFVSNKTQGSVDFNQEPEEIVAIDQILEYGNQDYLLHHNVSEVLKSYARSQAKRGERTLKQVNLKIK